MVHALRHTFATRLAEDGATATEIQALLGQASLNKSQGYIDATPNATRQAARGNRTYRALERISKPLPRRDSTTEPLPGVVPCPRPDKRDRRGPRPS
jgi:integrase